MNSKKLVVLAVIAVGAIALAIILWPGALPSPTPVSSSAAPQTTTTTTNDRTWAPGDLRVVSTDARTKPAIQLIDEVLVDRFEPCNNEPILINVRAHDERAASDAGRLPVRVLIDSNVGSSVPLSFRRPGRHTVIVSASTEDHVEEIRALTINVHDCGREFQYVAIKSEDASEPEVERFVATPFFDRVGGADASLEPGEELTYTWDFGDGTTSETTHAGYIEHDYARREQHDVSSTFVVKVEVASSVHGVIRGLTSVVLVNNSFENKHRFGVITPLIRLTSRTQDKGAATWVMTSLNYDPALTLTLDDVEITLTACGEGGDQIMKTFHKKARSVIDDPSLPPGKSSTRAHLEDVASSAYCSVSLKATGFAKGDLKVNAVFGDRLGNHDVYELRADADTPAQRKQYDRTMRALQLLGRDPSKGDVSVSDDEMRALELQGKL